MEFAGESAHHHERARHRSPEREHPARLRIGDRDHVRERDHDHRRAEDRECGGLRPSSKAPAIIAIGKPMRTTSVPCAGDTFAITR